MVNGRVEDAMVRGFWGSGSLVSMMLICGALAACSGGGEGQNADAGDADAADGGAGDVDTDADSGELEPPRCQALPRCEAGERVVACQCVSELDRRCTYDDECRPGETCEELEAGRPSVCIYEPAAPRECPGGPGCELGAQSELLAGAASMVITPQTFKVPPAEGESDPGWEADAMWLAGFSSGRPALFCLEERIGCAELDCCVSKFAHDDLKSQIVVLRQDETTVAM